MWLWGLEDGNSELIPAKKGVQIELKKVILMWTAEFNEVMSWKVL